MFLRRAPPKVVPMLGQLLQPELEEMIREGRFVDLRELIAEITVAALDALQLGPGDEIHATVKATDIEVYPA